MKLADQAALLSSQFFAVSVLLCTLPETEQSDEDILLGIFVCQERLPSAVGNVVASHKLDLIRADLVLDLVDANFTRAHIATAGAEVLHACKSELAKVAVLNTRCHERHGNVSLDTVDTGPRRDKSKNASN